MNQPSKACITRRWHRGLLTAVLAAMTGIAACGGGGSGGSIGGGEDLSSSDYMPAQTGDRWAYEETGNPAAYVTRVLGTRSTGRGTGMAVKSDLPGATESILVRDAQGVWQYPGTDADPIELVLGPIRLLPSPLRVGDSFVSVDKDLGTFFDFDGDGRTDAARLHADTQVVATESLDIAVGRLTDCLHLRVIATFEVGSTLLGRTTTISTVSDEWYAAGIGLVKTEMVTRGEGDVTDSYSQRLVGYRVGDRRSDTVAPTASAPGLVSSTPLGRSTTVDITFSEEMDVTTLVPALRVLDGDGAAVSGSTTVTGPRALRFVPAANWISGSYRATLSTAAQDLLGNPVAAAQVWPFVIDATAPVLVGSLPLAGSVDVPLASTIELHFDEAVDPASVNADTVRALYDGALLSSVTYAVSGTTVLLRPVTQLARGRSYSIQINGVTDLLGNVLTNASVAFATDPGRFGASRALAAASPDAIMGSVVAAGDVNGDGRSDVLADSTAWTGTEWAYGVSLYAQQADGTLAAPAALVQLPGNCSIRSMRVADFDRDGRQDLLIAASAPCGVMLWRQTTGGQQVLDRVIDPVVGLLAVPDVDRDGRPDVVIASTTTVKVWLNLSTGWVLNDTVTVPASPNQLAVGDVNGDGRPDLAVSSIERSEAVALMLQGADGHFGAVSSLSSDYGGGSFGVAIGDIDGDGRADLVAGDSVGFGVFHQQVDGQLAPYRQLNGTNFPQPVQLADFNADGRLDVLAAYADADLAVFLQQADGTLAEPASYPGTFHGSNDNPDEMAVGDVNGDARPDVLLNGYLFVQRPVPVMAQSVRATRESAPASGWWASLRRAAQGARLARSR